MEARQKKFASRVVVLRNQRGMTQEELAEAAGLTVEAISRIERCERAPRLSTLVKLADGFVLTLSELFDFEESQPRRTPPYRPEIRRLADMLIKQTLPKIRLIRKIAELVIKES